jgi:hypothetical protein
MLTKNLEEQQNAKKVKEYRHLLLQNFGLFQIEEQQNAKKVEEYRHSLLQNFGLFRTEYDKEHQKYAKCQKISRNKFLLETRHQQNKLTTENITHK